jgi:hypothetical protein
MICLIPELPDPIARRRDHGEAGALRTGRTQLGAGRVDFDPGAVLIVLMGEPTARIGREPRPRTAMNSASTSATCWGSRAAIDR